MVAIDEAWGKASECQSSDRQDGHPQRLRVRYLRHAERIHGLRWRGHLVQRSHVLNESLSAAIGQRDPSWGSARALGFPRLYFHVAGLG